jgi:hypothetical protein
MEQAQLRRKLVVAGLPVWWVLVGGASAWAQAPAAAGQEQAGRASAQASPAVINTDRPAITDSSVVAPGGAVVVENGFTETGNAGQQGVDFPETLVRFGITSKTELRFTPPDYFQNFNTGAGFGSGWGDLGVGVKEQLVASSTGFDASLIASVSFPTGASALSSRGYDPQLLLPWSHPISKNWTAAGMFSVLWPTQGGRRNVTGQPSFYVDRQITGKWDAFVEYAGDFPERGGPQHILHVGTSYKITNNQQLDFHVGFGLSAGVDHFVGFGYSFQIQALHREKH